MTGMTLEAVAASCGGKLYATGSADSETTATVAGVELDSRKLQKGYLFIATKGERVDGHTFIPQAFEKGCLGVVCESTRRPMNEVNDFFSELEGIFAAEDFTKAQVVESIKKFIPNFEHEEKGKNLDQKM